MWIRLALEAGSEPNELRQGRFFQLRNVFFQRNVISLTKL